MKNFFKCLTASLIFGIVIFASSCNLKDIAKQNVWVKKDVSYTLNNVKYKVSAYMMYTLIQRIQTYKKVLHLERVGTSLWFLEMILLTQQLQF